MPVKPSESRALIPEANTPLCPKVVRLFVQHPTITDRIVSDIWNEDGTVTDAFKAAIGLTVGGLAAPTNVVATDGVGTSVTISWSPVTGASTYKVYRGLANDSATATTLIGQPSATTLVDSSGTSGQVYWYFVKASNAGGDSSFSSGNDGYWGTTAGTPIEFAASSTWTAPAGVTTVRIETWGGGGNGGGRNTTWLPSGVNCGGGGGGGSGEYRIISLVSVTLGDQLVITVAALTALDLVNVGASGGTSAVVRSSVTLLRSAGGGGGGLGQPGAGGSGGAAGTGGEFGTATPGNVGIAGATITTGGAGGAAVNSYGAGGVGHQTATQGAIGHVRITPNA